MHDSYGVLPYFSTYQDIVLPYFSTYQDIVKKFDNTGNSQGYNGILWNLIHQMSLTPTHPYHYDITVTIQTMTKTVVIEKNILSSIAELVILTSSEC